MILLAFGTRPELIKFQPIIDILKKYNIKFKILFTGQHVDLINDNFYDYKINIIDGENRLDSIISSTMNIFSKLKAFDDNITHVIVQGDTTSALAVALSAFHHGVKVIHLEAGLRTYDKENPYPEEINRRLISQIADIHLCPTMQSLINLRSEEVQGKACVVGNTIIDNLIQYKDKCEYTNKILVTLHRRENHYWIDKWFNEINNLAIKYPQYEFIIPIHPNPNVQKHKGILTNVNIIKPLSYEEMLELLVKTRMVITDSGGLQEECSFFNKKCLVCRKVTERPEAIGNSSFIVKEPEDLLYIFELHHNNYEINYVCPYGDGHSAEKIYEILKNILFLYKN